MKRIKISLPINAGDRYCNECRFLRKHDSGTIVHRCMLIDEILIRDKEMEAEINCDCPPRKDIASHTICIIRHDVCLESSED